MNEAQAAKELHISKSTLSRMRKDGRISHIRIGKCVSYEESHITGSSYIAC